MKPCPFLHGLLHFPPTLLSSSWRFLSSSDSLRILLSVLLLGLPHGDWLWRCLRLSLSSGDWLRRCLHLCLSSGDWLPKRLRLSLSSGELLSERLPLCLSSDDMLSSDDLLSGHLIICLGSVEESLPLLFEWKSAPMSMQCCKTYNVKAKCVNMLPLYVIIVK